MGRRKGNRRNKQIAYSSKEKYSSAVEGTFSSETKIHSKTSVTDGISDVKLTDNNRCFSSEHSDEPRLHCGYSGQNIGISETKMHGAISKLSCPKYYPQYPQVSEINASKYPSCQTKNNVTKLTNNFNMHEKAKCFHAAFKEWENERQCTIQKLKKLVSEVHTDQLNLNKTKWFFKEINYHSRRAREDHVSEALDFLASLTTTVSDILDGFTSLAQAATVDSQQTKFQEIMEHDAEISKTFYEARARCIKEYDGIVEIIRNVRPNTFNNTIQKVTNILDLDQFVMDIKQAEEGSVAAISRATNNFIQRNAKREIVEQVYDSFQSYTEDNPATVDVCKSTCKVVIDIVDTLKRDSRNHVTKQISNAVNKRLLRKCREEVDELKLLTEDDKTPQIKLETEIHNTIRELESELAEFKLMASNVLIRSLNETFTNTKYSVWDYNDY